MQTVLKGESEFFRRTKSIQNIRKNLFEEKTENSEIDLPSTLANLKARNRTRIAQKDTQQITEKAIKELTEDTVKQIAKKTVKTFSREHSPLILRTKNGQKIAKSKAGKVQKTGKGRKK